MEIPTNCGPITPATIDNFEFGGSPSLFQGNLTKFHQMLCQCATTIAQPYMWVVVLNAQNLSYLKSQLISTIPDFETTAAPKWNSSSAINSTWTSDTQDVIGCVFAQAVKIPGETVNIEHVGIVEGSRRGFINAPIATGRADFEPLEISFLETNQSFSDGVIRPWSTLVNHRGLIATNSSASIKANITVYQLGKAGEQSPNFPRKIWTFQDCAPVNVASTDLSYQAGEVHKHQTSFVYNSYSLQTTSCPY